MKEWKNPTVAELAVLETKGGSDNGPEKKGKSKYNAGVEEPSNNA